MKKTVLKIATVAMICVFALSFVACSISQDYKTARANLRDNDYDVSVYDKDDVVSTRKSFGLNFLCGFLDDDVDDELEETKEDIEDDLIDIEKNLEKVLYAYSEDYDEFVCALYFESAKDAKAYYKLIKDVFEVAKKEGLDVGDISREDLTYGVNGIVVYFGTKEALKASR